MTHLLAVTSYAGLCSKGTPSSKSPVPARIEVDRCVNDLDASNGDQASERRGDIVRGGLKHELEHKRTFCQNDRQHPTTSPRSHRQTGLPAALALGPGLRRAETLDAMTKAPYFPLCRCELLLRRHINPGVLESEFFPAAPLHIVGAKINVRR